jgi:hypothetical protein
LKTPRKKKSALDSLNKQCQLNQAEVIQEAQGQPIQYSAVAVVVVVFHTITVIETTLGTDQAAIDHTIHPQDTLLPILSTRKQ